MTRIVVLLFFESVAVYCFLFAVGYWVQALIRIRSPRAAVPSSALMGFVVVVVAGWLVSYYLDIGLIGFWPWLLSISILANVVVIWRHRKTLRLQRLLRQTTVWANLAGVIVTFMIVVAERSVLLSHGFLSIAASGNNDSPSYALSAYFVNHFGLSSAGWITNFNLGHWIAGDTFGSYSYLGSIEWITRGSDSHVQLAALVVAIVLVVQSLQQLLRNWLRLPELWAVALSVTAVSTWLFALIADNYYLSEVLAIALTVALLDVVMQSDRIRDQWTCGVIIFVVVEMGLLMTYPAESFLFPIVIAIVFALVHFREPQRLRLIAGFIFGSLAVAMLLILPRASAAFHFFLLQTRTTVTWTQPTVLLWGVLGQGDWTSARSPLSWLLSVIIIALWFGALVGIAKRRGVEIIAAPAVLLGFMIAFYVYIYYSSGGPSYPQWKWITFVGPLIVVIILAPMVSWTIDHLAVGSIIAAGFVAILLISNLILAIPDSRTTDRSGQWVSSNLATLGYSPVLAKIHSINVDLPDFWSMMWSIDALAPRQLQLIQPSYYAQSRPKSDWTLVEIGASSAYPVAGSMRSSSHQEVRILNAAYALVRNPSGPDCVSGNTCGGTIRLLAKSSPTGASPLILRVAIRNTGIGVWEPSDSGSRSVYVRVSALSSHRAVVKRTLLAAPVRIWPFIVDVGQSQEVTIALSSLPKGTSSVQVNLVLRGVGTFSSFGSGSPLTIQVGH